MKLMIKLTSNLIFFSFGYGLLQKTAHTPAAVLNEPLVRTRTTCSRNGKQKSVKTAMHRYFRINKRIWIRAIPGKNYYNFDQVVGENFFCLTSIRVGYMLFFVFKKFEKIWNLRNLL